MPSRQVAQDALEEAANMLRLTHCAGKYHAAEAVLVEQTVVEGHELKVGRPALVEELEHAEAIFGVDRRKEQPGKQALLDDGIGNQVRLGHGPRKPGTRLSGEAD